MRFIYPERKWLTIHGCTRPVVTVKATIETETSTQFVGLNLHLTNDAFQHVLITEFTIPVVFWPALVVDHHPIRSTPSERFTDDVVTSHPQHPHHPPSSLPQTQTPIAIRNHTPQHQQPTISWPSTPIPGFISATQLLQDVVDGLLVPPL